MKRKSGKRRKARRQNKTNWTSTLDALGDRCRNIEALAGLVEVCDPHETRRGVIQSAGYLLCEEASKLRELVETIDQKGARP
jgi:hypothetical protein